VAPACLGYAVGLDGGGDAVALLYFVACGISRLARYNVIAEAIMAGGGKVTYFEGTPITVSVLLVLLLAVLAGLGRLGPALPVGAVSLGPVVVVHPLVALYLLAGSLMISKTLRIPKP
jgi:CDP-diacylglycerol--serine O-phosphatidyltransferase